MAILAVIALYHSLSNKWSNKINQALVTTKVLTVLIVVILGLSFAKASAERLTNKNVNWDMFSPAGPAFYQNVSTTEWIQRYITAMLTILFAYSGWNNLNCKHQIKHIKYEWEWFFVICIFNNMLTYFLQISLRNLIQENPLGTS